MPTSAIRPTSANTHTQTMGIAELVCVCLSAATVALFSSLLAHKCQGKYVLMATCCKEQWQQQLAKSVVDSAVSSA